MDDIVIDAPVDVELTTVNSPEKKPRVWTTFATPIAGLLLAIVFQTLIVIALIAWQVAQGEDVKQSAEKIPEMLSTPAMFMLVAGSAQLAFGLVTILAAGLSTTPLRQRLGLLPARQSWLIYPMTMLGSIAVLTIGIGFAVALTFIVPADPGVERLLNGIGPQEAVPFVLFIAVLPGVIEELLFRGYIQRRLLERWRPATAIIVASLLFALVHVQPHHVVLAFPLGVWFGVIAWRTGSVYPSMLCHAFVNGSLNAWRMVIKFGEVPEAIQNVVNVGAIMVGAVCLMLSINLLIDEVDSTVTAAPS